MAPIGVRSKVTTAAPPKTGVTGSGSRSTARLAPGPYPLRHEPFATPEALARTAGGRFVVRRHARWTDGHEVLLLAELARPSDDTR